MIDILIPNVSLTVFLGMTVILFGWAAFMTGQALASTWRPMWQVFPYSILLGIGDRLMTFFLFQGMLTSIPAYLFGTLILTTIALLAYRLTQVHKMITQYPWLYERVTLFSWRTKEVPLEKA
jgi:hypothetical protein